MSTPDKPVRPVPTSAPGYPQRAVMAQQRPSDESRRRFLRQLAGASALALTGLPRLAQGQSMPVDFSRLENHPGLSPASPLADELAPALEEVMAAPAEAELEEAADSAPAEAEAEVEGGERVATGERAIWLTENRALWVEPGYLVLLTWTRPPDDSLVAALEGSGDAVAEWFASHITQVDQIHNLELLHPLEGELSQFLAERLQPAIISVLHIDHDCTRVCSTLNPSRSYPERIEVMGEISAPGWE
jgi:hypothetical protein